MVISRVEALLEVVSGYAGAIVVPPRDPEALRPALAQAATMRGERFDDPHSWERTATAYQNLFTEIVADRKLQEAV